jgi:hypothetical protein
MRGNEGLLGALGRFADGSDFQLPGPQPEGFQKLGKESREQAGCSPGTKACGDAAGQRRDKAVAWAKGAAWEGRRGRERRYR